MGASCMSRAYITLQIDDALHFTEEQRKEIIAAYPAHELEARAKGIPQLGSGRIFPVPEDRIAVEHRDIPGHWARLGGMDFGYEHDFAAVEIAWDRDSDVAYVTRTYHINHASPIEHAAALRHWGKELRWSWPRDGKRQA
jgi:Terminase RNaseH-like domain/Terminase large subunit, T4likevirus-type, N-terminal